MRLRTFRKPSYEYIYECLNLTQKEFNVAMHFL